MLYEIKVYHVRGNKRHRLYATEIQASNPVIAIERACIRLGPSRLCEIREIPNHDREYPQVNKIQRNGVI
jgi:hypothetical protein